MGFERTPGDETLMGDSHIKGIGLCQSDGEPFLYHGNGMAEPHPSIVLWCGNVTRAQGPHTIAC